MKHETRTTMFTMLYKTFSCSKVKQIRCFIVTKYFLEVIYLCRLINLKKTEFLRHALRPMPLTRLMRNDSLSSRFFVSQFGFLTRPPVDGYSNSSALCAPVAQLDRVLDYESRGRMFESCRVYQKHLNPDTFVRLCSLEQGTMIRLLAGLLLSSPDFKFEISNQSKFCFFVEDNLCV